MIWIAAPRRRSAIRSRSARTTRHRRRSRRLRRVGYKRLRPAGGRRVICSSVGSSVSVVCGGGAGRAAVWCGPRRGCSGRTWRLLPADSCPPLSYVGKAANLHRWLGDHARDPLGTHRRCALGTRGQRGGRPRSRGRRHRRGPACSQPCDPARRVLLVRHDRPAWPLQLGRRGDYGCFPHLGHGAYSAPGRACIDGFTALGHVIQARAPTTTRSRLPVRYERPASVHRARR